MKLKVEIRIEERNKIGNKKRLIADIDIVNGRWKYWEDYFDDNEKIPLTINSINRSIYLSLPVKVAFPIYDMDLYHKERTLKVEDSAIICYESLVSYLNYQIEHFKEDIKSGFYDSYYKKKGGKELTATLFNDLHYNNETSVVSDIGYDCEGVLFIKIIKE